MRQSDRPVFTVQDAMALGCAEKTQMGARACAQRVPAAQLPGFERGSILRAVSRETDGGVTPLRTRTS
jgi:hypothetical protein